MPEQVAHEGQEAHNRAFYTSIGGQTADPYDDWAIIALFYSAVHTVEGYLAEEKRLSADQRHSRSHDQRLDALEAAGKTDAADTFRILRDASRQVRYECKRLPHRMEELEKLAFVALPGQLR